MTEAMRLEYMSLEHMTKQPPGFRYALFCDPVLKGENDCESARRLGHLGDYADYDEVRKNGLTHPHDVVIRFYPDMENRVPSEGFIDDFNKQKSGQ